MLRERKISEEKEKKINKKRETEKHKDTTQTNEHRSAMTSARGRHLWRFHLFFLSLCLSFSSIHLWFTSAIITLSYCLPPCIPCPWRHRPNSPRGKQRKWLPTERVDFFFRQNIPKAKKLSRSHKRTTTSHNLEAAIFVFSEKKSESVKRRMWILHV